MVDIDHLPTIQNKNRIEIFKSNIWNQKTSNDLKIPWETNFQNPESYT